MRSAVTETFYGFEHIKANTNMYRNTMYIPTITSWLHSQWHKLHRQKKNRIVKFDPHKTLQFSRRTSNKNNTEYRTSVPKITLLHQNKENSEKKQTQKQLFTVTAINAHDTYWILNFRHYPFRTLLHKTDVTQTANTALQLYSDFKQSQ